MKKIYIKFLLVCLFCIGTSAFAQTSYLGLDGGLEGTATVDNVGITGPAAGKWTKNNASQTIAVDNTVFRSGANSLKVNNSTTSVRRVWSPNITVGSNTTQVTVQFYIRVANTTNGQEQQPGIINNAEGISGTYTTGSAANTWTKVTYNKASSTWSTISGLFLHRAKGSGGDMYMDDMAVYSGGIDNTAPNAPASGATVNTPTASSLTVSWGAASGGVDGGGYMVVRYESNPGVNDDPLVNGIYAEGNTIAGGVNGTVVYLGTGLSYVDNGLSGATQYWYKVYTFDKAYNYSGEVSGNATTSTGVPTYTVTFDNNGGAGTMSNQTASTTTALTANTFTRTGYTFANWNTASNGSGTTYADGANYSFTADATLYAQWTVNQYSVSYNANGNDAGTVPSTQNGNYNSGITLATNSGGLTKSSFTFNGWNTNAAGSGTHYNVGASFTIPAANTVLYAEWISTAPTINTTGTLVSVNTTYGTASGNTSFSVSASNLVANLVITPPVGFEISTSSTFVTSFDNGSPLSITPTGGTVSATTIYLRLAATTPAGTYSGNIGLASGVATATVPTVSSVVNPKALTIINLVGTDKVYDRTTTVVVTGTPAYSGLVNSETFSVSGSVTWAFPDVNVGLGKTLTRTGSYNAPSANYTVTQPTVTASITAKALTVTGAAAQNKVYDGTNAATITGTLNGVIAPDAVTLNGTGTFASVNVGTGISVTSTSTLGGAQAGNYSLTQPTGLTADITPATAVLTTSSINLSIGGTYTLPGANISSNSPGALSYTIDVQAFASLSGTTLTGLSAGTATLTVTQAATANYSSTSKTVSVIVSAIVYTVNDYRTTSGGSWSSATAGTATWEKWDGVTPWAASGRPTATTSNVYIRHTITSNGSSTVNSVIVEGPDVANGTPGGNYSVSSGTTTANTKLLIKSGGKMKATNTITIGSGGEFEIEDNGEFTLNYLATNQSGIWAGDEYFHPASKFIITEWAANTGTTANRPLYNGTNIKTNTYNGYEAAFGNMEIDLSSSTQPNTFALIGTGVTKNLAHGDITFKNPNSVGDGITVLANGTATSGIGGTFTVDDLYAPAEKVFFTTSGTLTFTIGGNLQIDGSTASLSSASSAVTTSIIVNGNTNVTASGVLEMGSQNSGNPIINLDLKGDLTSVGSGLIQHPWAAKNQTINFSGNTIQKIDIASTSANRNRYINFNVKPGAIVQLANRDFELGVNSKVIVEGGGTLDFNFNSLGTALNITSVSTGNTFESQPLSTLKISSLQGITTTTGLGNVLVPASSRTYSQTADFWYIGRGSQLTGNGLTTGSTVKNVYVDLFDNTIDLKLSNRIGIADGGKLEIRKGILIAEEAGPLDTDDKDFYGTGTLVMSDGEYRIGTITSDPATLYLPKLSKYGSYSLTGGTVNLNGNNAIQKLSGSPSYYNVKFSGANTLGSVTVSPYATDYKTISSATSVSNNITLEGTAIVFTDDKSLGGTTTSFTMNGTSRYITGGGVTKPDAGGAYSLASGSTFEFVDDAVKEIRLSGIGGNPVYSNIIVRGTKVGTSSALAGINFLAGGTFTVKTGGVFRVIPTAGFSNKTGLGTTALSNVAPSDPAITLETGSTISYFGAAQTITNAALTFPTTANYQNLTISGSGLKTAPSTNLIVLGNIQKDSTSEFIHNNGTVVLPATIAQDILAGTNNTHELIFNNLKITNGVNVLAKSNFGVYRTLSFDGVGQLNLNSGDISLKSDVNNTANVDQITGAAAITYGTGRFIVERFINTGTPGGGVHRRTWQFLSVPVNTTQSIKAAWQEGAVNPADNPNPGYGTRISSQHFSVGTPNGFDQYTAGAGMKKYKPVQDQWDDGPATTGDGISNPNGYMLFVRGDRTVSADNATTPVTLRTRGQLWTGTYPAAPITVGSNLYESIGNPYASAIDLTKVNFSNLTEQVYIWDPTLGIGAAGFGRYRTLAFSPDGHYHVSPDDGLGAYTGIVDFIQSGQAFFVKASPAGGSVQFTEAAKDGGNRLVNRGGTLGADFERLHVNLSVKSADDSKILLDGSLAIFSDQYSRKVDDNDGAKLINSGENSGFKRDGKYISVERMPSPNDKDTLFLQVQNLGVKTYYWQFRPNAMEKAGRVAFLEDKFNATLTPINLGADSYAAFDVTDNPASAAADRFRIVFQKVTAPTPVKFISVAATRNADRSINVKWKVENEINITGYDIERSADGRSFTGILSSSTTNQNNYAKNDLSPLAQDNYYRIKASGLGGEITYSDIVKVAPLPTKASISVYPNPVENKTAQLIFANQPAGVYHVQVINNLGQVIYNSSVKVSGYNFVYPVELGAKISQGNYEVKVVNGEGKVSTQKIVIN